MRDKSPLVYYTKVEVTPNNHSDLVSNSRSLLNIYQVREKLRQEPNNQRMLLDLPPLTQFLLRKFLGLKINRVQLGTA